LHNLYTYLEDLFSFKGVPPSSLDDATLPTSQRGEGQQHTSASISNHGNAAQGSEFRQGIAESGNEAMEVSTIETPLGAAEPWVSDAQNPTAQEVNGVQTLESNVSDKPFKLWADFAFWVKCIAYFFPDSLRCSAAKFGSCFSGCFCFRCSYIWVRFVFGCLKVVELATKMLLHVAGTMMGRHRTYC
jgi:hypothetical protein